MKNSSNMFNSPFTIIAFVYAIIAIVNLTTRGWDAAFIWMVLAFTFWSISLSATDEDDEEDDNEVDDTDTEAPEASTDPDPMDPADGR